MQDIINQLVQLAKSYDPFTMYIDDYNRKVEVENRNKELREAWNNICEENNLNMFGVSCFANLGEDTEKEIREAYKKKI